MRGHDGDFHDALFLACGCSIHGDEYVLGCGEARRLLGVFKEVLRELIKIEPITAISDPSRSIAWRDFERHFNEDF